MSGGNRFSRLPTAAKLFLILTIAILPIGIVLTWLGSSGIREANSALAGRTDDQARSAVRAVESLVARNALALRVAANGALTVGPSGSCERVQRSLSIAPGVAQTFELEQPDGTPLCANGPIGDTRSLPRVAPGAIAVKIASGADAVAVRTGVIRGMATGLIPVDEVRAAIRETGTTIDSLVLRDGRRELQIIGNAPAQDQGVMVLETKLGNGDIVARVTSRRTQIATVERLLLLLPVLMWVLAALITWLLVSRLLIRPLKLLERGVTRYQPGDPGVDLPNRLGPSREIQELRDAFARAIARVDESERHMAAALEGQRRLVREVHHRVKNNLQVVASLLNIHGRSASTPEARFAYAGISRRVSALSIVHRNHFAEMEENRGIALRPLITELAAELRAGAPENARGLSIDLDLDPIYTTQDVAVAVAFLITEIVEFAMLNCPQEPIDISVRRTSEITGRLSLGNRILNPDEADDPGKVQFERIVGGLAKQLRSTLDRKLGRYSVDLPVFPPV